MYSFLLAFHVLICFALIVVILLQAGRGGGLAGVFGGGGGSQTVFGGRGAATFLSKATAILAVAFMLGSMSLAFLSARGPVKGGRSIIDSVIRREEAGTEETAPRRAPEGALEQPLLPGEQREAPGAGVVPSEVLPPEDEGSEQTEEERTGPP